MHSTFTRPTRLIVWSLAARRRHTTLHLQKEPATARPRTPEVLPGQVVKKPEVIDDFLRNFFVKMGLSRTCEAFESEWYELKATGRLDNSKVPDVYMRNAVSACMDACMHACMDAWGWLPARVAHACDGRPRCGRAGALGSSQLLPSTHGTQ